MEARDKGLCLKGTIMSSIPSERLLPWTQVSTDVLPGSTTADALTLAGLDWTVEKEPVKTAFAGFIVPDSYSIIRSDTRKPLGKCVGKGYNPISNVTGFEIANYLTKQNVEIESAGSLRNGRTVFMQGRLTENFKIAGDDIAPYILLFMTHDGSKALTISNNYTRMYCTNMLNMLLANSPRMISIRHTRHYQQRVERQAAKVLIALNAYRRNFEDQANGLLKQKFSKGQFESLMTQLFPAPPEDAAKAALTRHERTLDRVLDQYHTADLNEIRGTKWGALNAIVGYADHERSLRGTEEAKRERTFVRSFADTELKDRAMELLAA